MSEPRQRFHLRDAAPALASRAYTPPISLPPARLESPSVFATFPVCVSGTIPRQSRRRRTPSAPQMAPAPPRPRQRPRAPWVRLAALHPPTYLPTHPRGVLATASDDFFAPALRASFAGAAGIALHGAGKFKPAENEFGSLSEFALALASAQLPPVAAAAVADALRGAGAWRQSHGDGAEAANRWYAAAHMACRGAVDAGGAGATAADIAGKMLAQDVLINTYAAMVRDQGRPASLRTACSLACSSCRCFRTSGLSSGPSLLTHPHS